MRQFFLLFTLLPTLLFATVHTQQEFDSCGQLIREVFPTGHAVEMTYEEGKITHVQMAHLGAIHYVYKGDKLFQIERLAPDGTVQYTHTYHPHTRTQSTETLIGNVGTTSTQYHPTTGQLTIHTPIEKTQLTFDSNRNLISKTTPHEQTHYQYHTDGSLITHPPTESDLEPIFDDENRLISATLGETTVTFEYDQLGRRISKTVETPDSSYTEYSLYLGQHEIALVDEAGNLIALQIPGQSLGENAHPMMTRAIAMETKTQVFAPIYDFDFTLRHLIDIDTHEVIDYSTTPFGDNLIEQSKIIPWIFSMKHYDRELNLVSFGARFYNPTTHQFLTPDPLGTLQSSNLYQYCLNNPLKYYDPDGQFFIVIPLVLSLEAVAEGALILVGAYYTYKAVEKVDKHLQQMHRKKRGTVDPSLPKNPALDPKWEDISHPKGKENGHEKYRNTETGTEVEFDRGIEDAPGHGRHNHYHIPNPDSTGISDRYLDGNGNPVPDNHEHSHVYHPDDVWWD
ncbi:MAG: hypothetical protein S4CHLAM102_06030 [Chlamydiia bacterium]|nr:hypothetical protein [Chlamydiia bacterium]